MKNMAVLGLVLLAVGAGCESQRSVRRLEQFGKVYYLDGAGNLGFGHDTVPRALRAAGFRGHVENIIWTSFTGPLGDQVIRINARVQAEQLTKKIARYRKRYPHAPVYLIGLSAGTGVATWAVESLGEGTTVDTMVLLGSSLSSTYDMTKCLRRVKGRVYVVFSSRDGVLNGFVPITGTIDGQYLVQPAGLVGLKLPRRTGAQAAAMYREKVKNVRWRPAYRRYGYAGGHTDGTSYRFIKYVVAPQMLGIGREPPTTQVARSGR